MQTIRKRYTFGSNRHKYIMLKTRECRMNENGADLRRIVRSEIHPLPIDHMGNAGVTEGRYCPVLPYLAKDVCERLAGVTQAECPDPSVPSTASQHCEDGF
jgi:hypothetical protein